MKEKITKAYVQNHFLYFKWVYTLIVIFAVMGWSLIFSVTRPQVPEDKKIDVYFCGPTFQYDQDQMQAEAMEAFPDMEEIGFYGIDVDSYEGYQQFSVMLAAHEGDVFIISKSYLSYFVSEWLAVELDGYIQDGLLITQADYSKTTKNRVPDTYSNPDDNDTAPRIYAVECSDLYGMMLGCLYDNRDAVMIVTSYGGNEENAVKMVQWLYDRFYCAEEPDYIDNFDALVKQIQSSGY